MGQRLPWVAALVLLVVALGVAAQEAEEQDKKATVERIVDRIGGDFCVVIRGFEGERKEPICEDFDLDEKEVRRFFRHARVEEGWFIQRAYPWFGCWIEGALVTKSGRYEWQIGPGGTGSIDIQDEIVYLTCEEEACKEIFAYVGPDIYGFLPGDAVHQPSLGGW